MALNVVTLGHSSLNIRVGMDNRMLGLNHAQLHPAHDLHPALSNLRTGGVFFVFCSLSFFFFGLIFFLTTTTTTGRRKKKRLIHLLNRSPFAPQTSIIKGVAELSNRYL